VGPPVIDLTGGSSREVGEEDAEKKNREEMKK
jgi:hypothetical protein